MWNWGCESRETPDRECAKTLRRKGSWSQGERILTIESDQQGGRGRRLG